MFQEGFERSFLNCNRDENQFERLVLSLDLPSNKALNNAFFICLSATRDMGKFLLKFGSILLLNLFAVQAISQMELTGVIVDKETGDPIPYAQVMLMMRPAGTLSNLEGEFRINVSDRDATDTLIFMYLGYSKMKIPVSKYIASKISKIEMSTETFLLKELVVNLKRHASMSK